MKKKTLFTAMVLCLSLTMSACAGTQTNEETNNNNANNTAIEKDATQTKLDVLRPAAYSKVDGLSLEPGSTISIIGRYSGDSFWNEVEAGAREAIDNINTMLGYKGSDKVKLSFCAPNIRDDVDEQVNLLDEELNREPIAVGIAAIDKTACSIQFDLAAENGIRIVTFDSGSDYQDIAAHISTNNIEAAKTAATKLADELEGSGEVAVFVQDSSSMTAKNRLQGFSDCIATNYPEITVVNTYHLDQLETMQEAIATEKNAALGEDATPIEASSITQEDVIQYILEKNPNLKGIYTTNLDTTQLIANVLKSLEKTDLKFVGFDGGSEQTALLEDGTVDGLIVQNPFAMGYATVIAAARVSLGLANESYVDSGYTWVTKDNMTDDTIKKMLY